MMHKVRQNSLSPCCSSNKENIIIENLVSPDNVISFRNLQKHRKKINPVSSQYLTTSPNSLRIDQKTPHAKQGIKQSSRLDNCSSSTNISSKSVVKSSKETHNCLPASAGVGKKNPNQARNTNIKEHQRSDRSIEDYRCSLKSKQKQMVSLHSQVKCLNHTIVLLKQQICSLRAQNNIVNEQKKQMKQQLSKVKQGLLQAQTQKNANNNYSDYETIMSKLSELEQIQDGLLKQNERLKKRQAMQSAVLKNVKILLKVPGDKSQTVEQILNLVCAYTV